MNKKFINNNIKNLKKKMILIILILLHF